MIGLDPTLNIVKKFRKNGNHGNEKKPKMVFFPEKPLELQIKNLACTYNFTMGVTWFGSHMTTPLPLPVLRLEMPKMVYQQEHLN